MARRILPDYIWASQLIQAKQRPRVNHLGMRSSGRRVDIRRLKSFAFQRLPRNCPLRDILLAERDELEVSSFLAKMELWLKLLTGPGR